MARKTNLRERGCSQLSSHSHREEFPKPVAWRKEGEHYRIYCMVWHGANSEKEKKCAAVVVAVSARAGRNSNNKNNIMIHRPAAAAAVGGL